MRVFLSMLLCLLITGLHGQEFKSGRYHTDEGGLMFEGYDPVSYFLEDGPLRGRAELKEVYDGLTFYFATEQNRDQFKRSPEKYLPAYGGFCAFGMGMDPAQANGYPQGRYKTSPLSYKIIDKRVYLFYPENEWTALRFWNQNEAALKVRADNKWKEIRDK